MRPHSQLFCYYALNAKLVPEQRMRWYLLLPGSLSVKLVLMKTLVSSCYSAAQNTVLNFVIFLTI
jgi:hypothetical protein